MKYVWFCLHVFRLCWNFRKWTGLDTWSRKWLCAQWCGQDYQQQLWCPYRRSPKLIPTGILKAPCGIRFALQMLCHLVISKYSSSNLRTSTMNGPSLVSGFCNHKSAQHCGISEKATAYNQTGIGTWCNWVALLFQPDWMECREREKLCLLQGVSVHREIFCTSSECQVSSFLPCVNAIELIKRVDFWIPNYQFAPGWTSISRHRLADVSTRPICFVWSFSR